MPLPRGFCRRILFLLPGILSASLITGCASIESFHATPRNVCAGDTVIVTWQAKGTVELTSTPPAQQTSAPSSEGSPQFVVQESTRFALKASRLFSGRWGRESFLNSLVSTTQGNIPLEKQPLRQALATDFGLWPLQ